MPFLAGPRLVLAKSLSLLSPPERKQLWLIGLAMLVTAVFEVIGVASLAPFIAIASDRTLVERNHYLSLVYRTLDFQSYESFVVFVGLAAFVCVLVMNVCSVAASWLLLNYGHQRVHSLSSRLLKGYLSQPYSFFLQRNNSDLLRHVVAEVGRAVGNIILPLIFVAARLVVATFLVLLLLWADPRLALGVTGIIGGVYVCIYLLLRRWLARIGRISVEKAGLRYRYASEALEGIKEVKLLGIERAMLDRYEGASVKAAQYEARGQAVGTLPRYFLETIAFGVVIAIVIYLLRSGRPMNEVLPLVAMYAFAGYRLLPTVQNIYAALTQIRFNFFVLDLLCRDVEATSHGERLLRSRPHALAFEGAIELHNVSFKYQGRNEAVLEGVDLKIPARATIGIVGGSGAGKTTLADLVLGLLPPTSGRITVDGVEIVPTNVAQWRAALGYVPQLIHLTDSTIAENIAFGFDGSNLDMTPIERAARAANLHDFIVGDLPNGYGTLVGDRGVRLSGGQRQRIAIARALYRDPKVLVLDEATSSLDSITEDVVMEAIRKFSHSKTLLIIAHRLSTLRECDRIYVLSGGRIAASGSYSELLETSDEFRTMARTGGIVG